MFKYNELFKYYFSETSLQIFSSFFSPFCFCLSSCVTSPLLFHFCPHAPLSIRPVLLFLHPPPFFPLSFVSLVSPSKCTLLSPSFFCTFLLHLFSFPSSFPRVRFYSSSPLFLYFFFFLFLFLLRSLIPFSGLFIY